MLRCSKVGQQILRLICCNLALPVSEHHMNAYYKLHDKLCVEPYSILRDDKKCVVLHTSVLIWQERHTIAPTPQEHLG